MQCREIRDRLARGEIPPGADEHLLECEECAALVVGRLSEQPAPALQVEPLLAAVEAQIANERGIGAWLRSRTTFVRGLLAAMASLLLVFGIVALARRGDLAQLSLQSKIALLLYAVAACVLAAELLRPMHKRQRPALRRWLGAAAFGMPIAMAVWLAEGAHDSSVVARKGCLLLGLLVSTPLLLLLRGLDRGAPARASQRLLAVSTAAIVGNFALVLCCASTSASHILRAHAPLGFWLALNSMIFHWFRRSASAR